MKIELKEVSIRELTQSYTDSEEDGVVGFDGKLNIRPAYQREFVYKAKQRDAVLDTVKKNLPLNTMYWVDNEDGSYELLDGQQRTISICQYINGEFSLNHRFWHNLEPDEQKEILDYKLMIYVCIGDHSDKMEWFQTINIAGEKLTQQELRNINYMGQWLSDGKAHFSKTNCPAWNLAKDYVKGSPIRQEFLQTAIDWASENKIEWYMAKHQRDSNANALWIDFQQRINWIKTYFPNYRKEMKGLPIGEMYDLFKDEALDSDKLEAEIVILMKDEDVTKKQGIYQYVLNKDEKHLNIRAFNDKQKREAYERQAGICVSCSEEFKLKEMHADHITPWSKGGKTIADNCQMLCAKCNRTKSDK